MRQLKITKRITVRESVALDKYLNDISKIDLLTGNREAELAVMIRNGSQEALEELTSANLRFVVSVAKQYQNQGLSLPDLINEGNVGLLKAAKRFDETKGFKFISYAVWWIRQSILAAIVEYSRLVRLPINKVNTYNKLNAAVTNFNQEFESFSIAKADMGYAFSVSDKLSFNVETHGGFKVGNNSTNTLDFALGGFGNNLINNFVPFIGYDFISLTGNSYVKASVIADYEIFKKHHISLEGNWANIDDNIFDSGEWFTLPDYRGYALGYAIDTFLGPIQTKYSYSPEQKKSTWFFNIGFWF